MKNHQLPLIDALCVDSVKDSGPSRPAHKFVGTVNPTHWTALLALLRNALPSDQFSRIGHPTSGTDFAEELRQLGLELPTVQVPIVSGNDDVVHGEVYALTVADVRRINRWFAKTGGVYA
ncbi:hypothetical protein SAMN04515617_105149 [Collimonas sp. OK242]|uniref:hypothetical protein n=1 Tax=Collimonas sp. OK242 TaxID=1798195 RepID=UPI000896C0D3|nr:hypothetical protein [Collimonas sp. OK242]SDX63004.1 hypothetical protein SAMN04515617_105149 [Collimonas sp. OK242]